MSRNSVSEIFEEIEPLILAMMRAPHEPHPDALRKAAALDEARRAELREAARLGTLDALREAGLVQAAPDTGSAD